LGWMRYGTDGIVEVDRVETTGRGVGRQGGAGLWGIEWDRNGRGRVVGLSRVMTDGAA
jgi:hypothetical protein